MSDMTQSFIEMVEAFKAKPELEAKIDDLTRDNAMCYGTIDQLRFEVETLKSEAANLHIRLSEVTKERDDASFRNLELDEKLAGIEKLLGLAERLEQARRDEHQATVDAMTPKQEPVQVLVEPKPYLENYWDRAEQIGPIDPVVVEGQSAADPMPVGQPENDTTTSKDGAETPAPSDSRPINPYSGFPVHYPDGEYKGQPYYDKPSWVSWAAWVDAGGEAEPYMKNFG